jgi:hypothetical protein
LRNGNYWTEEFGGLTISSASTQKRAAKHAQIAMMLNFNGILLGKVEEGIDILISGVKK